MLRSTHHNCLSSADDVVTVLTWQGASLMIYLKKDWDKKSYTLAQKVNNFPSIFICCKFQTKNLRFKSSALKTNKNFHLMFIVHQSRRHTLLCQSWAQRDVTCQLCWKCKLANISHAMEDLANL